MENKQVDWSKIKIRCSSIGAVMTEPQNKGDKEAGNLSETAKAELIKIYNLEKYGRKTEIVTRFMEKGIQAEEDSMKLLGKIDNIEYTKNDLSYENEYIKGTPDIIFHWNSLQYPGKKTEEYHEVYDIKTSWSLDSFQQNRYKKVDRSYFYQILGYMALLQAAKGQICYCLTNTPDAILNGELYRLFSRMDCVTEDDPMYKRAAKELEKCHKFDDIPEIERVIRIKYDYNDEEIQKVYQKVKKCRQWLEEFDNSSRIL